jgi:hypothetical protein
MLRLFGLPWLRTISHTIPTCLAVFLLGGQVVRAETVNEGSFWVGYMSSLWLDPRWALWFDTHYNLDSFWVIRGGLTRAFESGASVTGGYAYLLTNPHLQRQEHRPWAQAVIPLRLSDNWRFSQRVRTDFRVQQSLESGRIASGWDFTFRARFQSTLTYRLPPLRFGQPILQIGDEVLLDLGSTSESVGLDQNRASLMLGIEFDNLTVRVGYMNRFIPGGSGLVDTLEHAAVLWFTHSIDLGMGAGKQVPESGGP